MAAKKEVKGPTAVIIILVLIIVIVAIGWKMWMATPGGQKAGPTDEMKAKMQQMMKGRGQPAQTPTGGQQ